MGQEERVAMVDIGGALLGAVVKTAMTNCRMEGERTRVSVAFSAKEMKDLGQGGMMLEVGRRMEELIEEEHGGPRFLPESFFECLEYGDEAGHRVFTFRGPTKAIKRSEDFLKNLMRRDGIEVPA